jgi:triosephosphate isomerase
MRIPFIAGNWKMNTTLEEAVKLLRSLKESLADVHRVDVAVCPPYPFLFTAAGELAGSRISLGAQNMYGEEKGAFTGEVSPAMLKNVGCDLVILGHSERRQLFGETNEKVNWKIDAALRSKLFPIVCVGETLDQRENGQTEQVIEEQISGCFKDLSSDAMKGITVAYEPIWAIGTGKTASPQEAQQVHQFIRKWLENRFDKQIADEVRIQYGGSVKPENASDILNQKDIDGALVGGASLNSESFAAIIRAA